MKAYEVKGNLQIDQYGHKELFPPKGELPEGAVFVAGAIVWMEAISTNEKYWLNDNDGSGTVYSLWYEIGELRGEFRCCARIKPEEEANPEVVARWLVTGLWFSRISEVMAMTLEWFDDEGLLSLSFLDELADSYHNAINSPEVPKGAELETGEIFYESGELKYRGEHWQECAHGKGTAYWKNSNVWCDGSFKDHQPHGYCRIYFRDGGLRYEGRLEEGLPYGPGREFFDNGQLRFEGVFDRQTHHYGYGARKYVRGKLYSGKGRLIHNGDFVSDGHQSKPVKSKSDEPLSPFESLLTGQAGILPIDVE